MREGNSSNGRVTWEGCSVLLDINDGDRLVFARLSPAAKLKIGNKNCSLQPLIGRAFGTVFQVDTAPDGPCLSPAQVNVNNAEEIGDGQGNDELRDKVNVNSADEVRDGAVNIESRDNRALVDNNTAQSLTGEDIEAMRSFWGLNGFGSVTCNDILYVLYRQGAGGNEIIEALIANSATFEKKTSFSQEKYRLKKQKKYAPKVLMRRPVARRDIPERYILYGLPEFCSVDDNTLRCYAYELLAVDTLSLLLSMANVSSNSDILVVDMIGGLLTGAVAERLGGIH
ncbi:hypothetical protein V8G54_037936 (chloroplast) [Vigna mungo]|uniref:tRNA (adenine(58)-N(1))-methyltransferase non-catalytic subunit TRM6 n=1 Tax=Vigna mungo TaxID=3915 RepID=A0AAQ3MDB0_VIGMU